MTSFTSLKCSTKRSIGCGAIRSSAVSSPLFSFSTAVRNATPSFGSESINRLGSAIGARLSYFFRSSSGTFRTAASFPKISSEGNRLPSSTSERKGEEMPILFASSRTDKSALSRNSRSRWPKEVSSMCQLKKLAAVWRAPRGIWQASAEGETGPFLE